MKWNEILNELFDRTQDIQIEWDDGYRERMANISELDLRVGFTKSFNWNYVIIAFSVGHRFELTGGGNAINIFNAVLKSVDQYMQKFEHPYQITFSADNDEPSRIKLYTRLAKRLSTSYGYELNDIVDKYGEHGFKLNKIGVFADEPLNEMATAYHGSPHRGIAKFSTDKIGTGEGAQAYGWGLYFTDSPKIAEWYRENLTKLNAARNTLSFSYNGVEYPKVSPEGHALNLIKNDGKRNALSLAKSMLKDAINKEPYTVNNKVEHYQKLYDFVLNFDSKKARSIKSVGDKGQIYEVEIPDDDIMLHWDLPVSKQPMQVKRILKEIIDGKQFRWEYIEPSMQGGPLYKQISSELADTNSSIVGDKLASAYLFSMGIKGIKYKAGELSGVKSKNYNYVIFNGDDIKIKNSLILNEVAFSNGVGSPNWNDKDIITNSTTVGTIDHREVKQYTSGNMSLYFFNSEHKIDAFILIQSGKFLRGMQNNSTPGMITALMVYVLGNILDEVYIGYDEPMTPAGAQWVNSALKKLKGKFEITKHDGDTITSAEFMTDWNDSWDNPNGHSDLALKIRFRGNALVETNVINESLFLPRLIYIGNRELK